MTSPSASRDAWTRRFGSPRDAAISLICFPHAGGSATYYSWLARSLAPEIELIAVQYPGRQDRRLEECIDNIPELSDQNRECFEFLITAASRMDALVNALLAYSTVDAAAGQPLAEVDAATVLTGVLDNLRTAMDESGTVVTHDPLPQVAMESTHLGQIFQNLISNAIKYRGADSPRIHVSSKLTSGEWVFSVADNGIGIEPKYHGEIFDVFKRLHPQEVSGSGIGLATCRRIIERYRGRIWVESVPGNGSTFFFSLPSGSANAHSVSFS